MIGAAPRPAIRQVGDVLWAVLSRPPLRRIELAFAAFSAAEWGVWIAMLVYAYGRGGATEAGIVAAVQLAPAAVVAPVASALGDRYRPGLVVVGSYVAQALAMGLTATILLAGGPAFLAYAAATLAATAVTVTRPAMWALVPTVVRTPDELTATNVVSSWIESMSVLVAPALAGLILAVSSPGAVFAVMSVAVLAGALLVVGVPGPPPAGGREANAVATSLGAAARVLRSQRSARALVVVLCADFVAIGALDVLYPALAIGELSLDDSWAAYLNAAFGAGAALAVVVTAGYVGRRRLMPPMLAGLAIYLVAFILLAAYPTTGSAVVLLGLAGAGRVMLDVAARTLLQRVAPADMLSRVFGLLEGLSMAGLAVGSLLVAALVGLGGPRLAIVGIGLVLPLAAVAAGRGLLSVDRHATVPVVEVGLLRGLPLFASLAPATLAGLAGGLEPLEVCVGDEVIRQGDVGDRFYIVASGSVQVRRDDVAVATLGRGDAFGEIALLHDVRRTATCVATASTRLYVLEQADFLAVLTGHPQAHLEAVRLADERTARVMCS